MAFKYREGPRTLVPLPLDSDTGALSKGQAITQTDATVGYVKDVDAVGEAVSGFTKTSYGSPAADGEIEALVDISKMSIYEVSPNTGTVTQALLLTTVDVGADGLTVRIAGVVRNDLLVVGVDVTNNTLRVQRA